MPDPTLKPGDPVKAGDRFGCCRREADSVPNLFDGREIDHRMWEFKSFTGKTFVVTDGDIKHAYDKLFPSPAP